MAGLRCALWVGVFLLSTNQAQAEKIDDEKLFAPDHLISIEITMAEEDWSALRRQSRSMRNFGGPVEDVFTWFKGDISIDGVKVPSVAIRKKGFIGSLDTNFPSLKIKFDEYQPNDPIKNLDRLTLNNNKQDRGLVSQFLTYQFFNEVGLPAPRVNYAKVSVNGTDLGIYSHVESIRKPFLKRAFGDKSGHLYEGTIADFYPKAVQNIEAKTKKSEAEREATVKLAEILGKESPTLEEIETLVDVDVFLKFWATESLLGFWDGYANNQNNYYAYFHPVKQKFYFIPWGADMVFTSGRGPFGGGRFGGQNQATAIYTQSLLAHRLYHCEGIPQRYRKTMETIIAEHWDKERMIGEIDRIEKLVADHLHDRQRNAPREMQVFRDFINNRPDQIAGVFARQWPITVQAPRKPSYQVEVGSVQGQFTALWNEEEAGSLSEATIKMNDKPLKFEVLDLRMRPGRVFTRGGFGGPPPEPTAELVVSLRSDETPRLTITVQVDQKRLKESNGEPVSVTGSVQEGGFGRGGKQLAGKLTVTSGELVDGEKIIGVLDLKMVEQRGGMFGGNRGGFGGGSRRPGNFGGGFTAPNPLMTALDENRDGEISAQEIANAEKKLKSLDRNRDGKLGREELSPPRTGFGGQRPGGFGQPGGTPRPGGFGQPGGTRPTRESQRPRRPPSENE